MLSKKNITLNKDKISLSSVPGIQKLPFSTGKEFVGVMSTGQARLWYLSQIQDPPYTYNDQLEVHVEGALDIHFIERSLNKVIQRHEILRTVFKQTEKGELVQIIKQPFTMEIPLIPVGNECMEETALRQELDRVCLQQGQPLYDLTTGPLFRVCVLQLPKDKQIFLFSFHHIILDGRSLIRLLKEVNILYAAESQGLPAVLTGSPLQCVDYACWEKKWMQTAEFKRSLRYWKRQLKNLSPSLNLPIDYPRPAQKKFYGAWEYFRLPKVLTEKLLNLSRRESVSLYVVLLAAYKSLLMRYTGQSDIAVGTVIANRRDPCMKEMLGFFAETTVLRSNLSAGKSFKQLLHDLKTLTKTALYTKVVPFNALVEQKHLDGALLNDQLVQAVLVFKSLPFFENQWAGRKVSRLALRPMGIAKFDITLSLEMVDDGLLGYLEYNTDLFKANTVSAFLQHYHLLLESIAEDAGQDIAGIPLLTEEESRRIIYDWNATASWYPKDQCIFRLFEKQAELFPTAVAVTCEEHRLTYGKLNEKSNQLANYLIKQGIGPEARVGLCIDRSLEMIVGMLSILKAGGAYVPVDPDYPPRRIEYLLSDSGVNLVLTQEYLLDTTFTHNNILRESFNCLCLDRDWPIISGHSNANPNVNIAPANTAYIIYTSGSTGRPKGVPISHSSLLNLCCWHQKNFKVDENSKATQVASPGFDAAVWELWPYLTVGAQIFIVRRNLILSPERFAQWIGAEAITHGFVPTPLLKNLLNGYWSKKCDLQFLLTGGDKLSRLSLPELPFKLVNNYGLTEAAVVSASAIIDPRALSTPAMGRPISNTTLYVLDSSLDPVPVGVSGELYIGGVGLSNGYLNRPDLTASRFVPDHISSASGKRLYRSGDLVRYLPDGNIDFIARIDDQVKIRGFRIELGEIENALLEQDEVRQAIATVFCRKRESENKYIVAYITLNPGKAFNQNDLRTALQSVLPGYMVPSFFIALEELPLTPNGKINRKALPEPVIEKLQDKKHMAATTEKEHKLAILWANLLRVSAEHIGVDNNFFELGGDSILSLQLIAQARKLNLYFTPKQLFERPTIRELAKVVKEETSVRTEQGNPTGPAPLLPIQQWFFEKIKTDIHHWNQAFLIKISANLRKDYLVQAMERVIGHHDAFRLRFNENASGWTQSLEEWDGKLSLTQVDLSFWPPESRQRVLEEKASELQAQLNIQQGPMLRACLFRMGDSQLDRLLVVIHHLVIDGVSWRIFLEDLETAYRQLSAGEPVKLPGKTTSYKTWSEHLQSYNQSDGLKAELEYWLQLEQQILTRHQCPLLLHRSIKTDAGINTVASAKTHMLSLDRETTRILLQKVPIAYNTQINDVLLTALLLAFHQWTGENTLLIDLEGHGREDLFEDVDLSRTLGWFTAIYPMCLVLQSSSDLGLSLKSVKEQLRNVPHHGIGYGLLRHCRTKAVFNFERPGAQICFNYLGQFDQPAGQNSLFQLTSESAGSVYSPRQMRPYLLAINSWVMDGRFQLSVEYSCNIHKERTIVDLASQLFTALHRLISHCLSSDTSGYTPSDFLEAELASDELDALIERLEAQV